MKTTDKVYICILLLAIAVLLITPLFLNEGFQAGMPGKRCGVDLPACNQGLQCMNGFCEPTVQPSLLSNQLSVYP